MIEKMKLVHLSATPQNYKEMLIRLSQLEFHGEPASALLKDTSEGEPLAEDPFYTECLSELSTLSATAGCQISRQSEVTRFSKEEIEAFLGELREQFEVVTKANQNAKLSYEDETALEALRSVGFEDMHGCQYLFFRFGRLNHQSFKKLSLYTDHQFDVCELYHQEQTHWVCYVTSPQYGAKVNKIFDDLYFEPIAIPEVDVKALVAKYTPKMNEVYTYCSWRHDLLKLYKYVIKTENTYEVTGFVSSRDFDGFKEAMEELSVKVEATDPDHHGLLPPTLLKNNWFVRPFEMFVGMYSLPSYFDFDPTSFFCYSYCLLFGIMFGDLGQGALVAIGGFVLAKLKPQMRIAAVAGRVGLTSMVFGFLFGSFFGDEHILIPLQKICFGVREKLFEVLAGSSTMPILMGSVLLGAILILMCMVFNMALRIKHKEWGELLCGQNGIAGFVFYSYLLIGIAGMFSGSYNILTPVWLALFAGGPLILILLEKPFVRLFEGQGFTVSNGWGNHILEAIFEDVVVLLDFVANSMSFMRVGGFVLSHAGMMLVVMTLVEMTGKAGFLVFVLGNLFVMVLEGLIVGIQSLRLEYYEMFSRYYSGSGKSFQQISKES
ncbi:MAG: ATPase V [Erysipelotrichaceae bacterium]|jgi:V/A-type H+-transporting ATPase subunit I|nr:ATPase V [Erysipelotrichaceae bacterium]